ARSDIFNSYKKVVNVGLKLYGKLYSQPNNSLLSSVTLPSSQQSISFNTNISFQFESQIRTTPLGSGVNSATAIRAFAAKSGSLKISITVSRRNQLLVHLNDEELTFESDLDTPTQLDITTLRFEDFSISKNRTNNQIILSTPIGVSVQISPIFVTTSSTLVLNIAAVISGELKRNWTLGLIGSYDGNPLNDLRDSSGILVGTVDALSPQEIHEVTICARDACGIPLNATDSLLWSPIQRTCYYDISVTGDVDFGRVSREAAEQQVEQREAMRNPPKFNSALSLTRSVRVGEQVDISFQATSEFSSNIIYKLLHGPNGATLNEATGHFEWKVPEKMETISKIPVQVSAQDTAYNLMSTYEVLLEVQQKSNAPILTSTVFLLALAFASRMMLQ
ncbi:unnamed protein product, partial [Adineta steineri]